MFAAIPSQVKSLFIHARPGEARSAATFVAALRRDDPSVWESHAQTNVKESHGGFAPERSVC